MLTNHKHGEATTLIPITMVAWAELRLLVCNIGLPHATAVSSPVNKLSLALNAYTGPGPKLTIGYLLFILNIQLEKFLGVQTVFNVYFHCITRNLQ